MPRPVRAEALPSRATTARTSWMPSTVPLICIPTIVTHGTHWQRRTWNWMSAGKLPLWHTWICSKRLLVWHKLPHNKKNTPETVGIIIEDVYIKLVIYIGPIDKAINLLVPESTVTNPNKIPNTTENNDTFCVKEIHKNIIKGTKYCITLKT
jgi:hypothetical protein